MLSATNLAGQSKTSQRQARAVLSAGLAAVVKEEIVAFNPLTSARGLKVDARSHTSCPTWVGGEENLGNVTSVI